MVRSHASPAGAGYWLERDQDPGQWPSVLLIVGLSMGFLDSLMLWYLDSKSESPMGEGMTVLYPILRRHGTSFSPNSIGPGSCKNPPSFKGWRWGTREGGCVLYLLMGAWQGCRSLGGKIMLLPSLQNPICHTAPSIILTAPIEIWSCHSLVLQQGTLFSNLHPTQPDLFCGAASLHGVKGI